MKRYEMVKSHEDFNKIIQTGSKISNKYMVIFKLKSDGVKPKFGIAVGKKLGNAVVRNKLKRQFRNIIDNHRNFFKNNYNYIIMIKREANEATFATLEEEFIILFGKDNS